MDLLAIVFVVVFLVIFFYLRHQEKEVRQDIQDALNNLTTENERLRRELDNK